MFLVAWWVFFPLGAIESVNSAYTEAPQTITSANNENLLDVILNIALFHTLCERFLPSSVRG